MKRIQGDILEATEEYLLHQCNCLTTKCSGLAAALAKKFSHARLYQMRRSASGRSLAIPQDRSTPGSIVINWSITPKSPHIINLMGQWRPGKVSEESRYPESDPPETETQRLIWFKAGLREIGEHFRKKKIQVSIAVPYKIGCGLAGGNWSDYEKILEEFQEEYVDVVSLSLYRL